VKGDSRLAAAYAVVGGTPKASRVAAFVALWATALIDLDVDVLGIEEYGEWASESTRTAYRRLADFRALWPEYDTPNELALLLVQAAQKQGSRRPEPSLAVAL